MHLLGFGTAGTTESQLARGQAMAHIPKLFFRYLITCAESCSVRSAICNMLMVTLMECNDGMLGLATLC